jgi:hypothetical protein
MKGFRFASYISSPFPKLAWRKDMFVVDNEREREAAIERNNSAGPSSSARAR